MHAIASLLDPKSDRLVRQYWKRFEMLCDLTGIRVTPVPHFSWMSADRYQVEGVKEVLAAFAEEELPLEVQTAGLGIFTGRQPVVYIALVKDERMIQLHRRLWEQINPFAERPNMYYHPKQWVPHITLANYDVDPGRLGCAIEQSVFEEVGFTMVIQDFSILYREGSESGLISSIPFKNVFLDTGGTR